MHDKFGQQAQFLLIYIREAHPTDGWKHANSQWADPRTQAERNDVATKCCQDLKIKFPAVVDTMDDATAVAWAAWPERIFVVGIDGRVAYAGEQGPWGFWPTDDFQRQAMKNMDGKKSKPDAPVRNFKGDSLERFLTRLRRPQPIEVIEPRAADLTPRATAPGNERRSP